MSHIIAGDPAPTNPTARLRTEVLAGLSTAFDGTADPAARAESLLNRYDALKRAEVLAEAADEIAAAVERCRADWPDEDSMVARRLGMRAAERITRSLITDGGGSGG